MARHRLDVAGQQLVEAQRLARGLRGAGGLRRADLGDGPGGHHRLDAGVDARVQGVAVHHQPDQPGRVPGVRGPQAVGAARRLELAEVQQLQRAHDPAAIARGDGPGRPWRPPCQARVQRLGAVLAQLGLPVGAHLVGRLRAQVELGQGRPQVEPGAADHERRRALGQQRVDLGVGQAGELADAEARVDGHQRDEPVLQAGTVARGRHAGQRLQPAVDLQGVGGHRHGPAASGAQAVGQRQSERRLADRRGPEDGEDAPRRWGVHGAEYRHLG